MLSLFYQIFNHFNKTERQIFWAAFLVFIVSGLMISILTFENLTIEVPAESNMYNEGAVGQPTAINPVLAGSNEIDRDLIELLFSDLADLAENFKVSDDGQTWNVFLKPGLKWSDGKPLTSDDIIYTLDVIQDSESRSPLFLTWQGVIINRISERELEFTLRTPYVFFLDNLKDLKIIPKHIFGAIPTANFHLSDYNLEPVGSGPYYFSNLEKKKNGFITNYHLAANPNFSGGKSLIQNLNLKFYQNNGDLINAFNSKLIDGFGGINPKNITDLRLGHQILEKNMPRYYAIFLNKNSKPALNDKNIALALNLAINKEEMIKKVFDGRALTVNGPIPPIIGGYDRTAESVNEFSVEKANQVLNSAKWIINPESKIREKKIGKQLETLEFSIIVPEVPFLTETIGIIKENWSEIGVKLNPIILNPNDIANEVIKTRNYQMIIFGNILKNNPDIFSFWHSSERFYPGLNLALYNNKKVDSLLEAARKNPKEDSRNQELSEIQKLINEDQPAIFLYSPSYIYIAPKNFGGFNEKIITTPTERFENVNQWYLETTRIFK